MQPSYARHYRSLWERHWWWRSREALVLGWVASLHRRSARQRILDVGCGDGLFFERLARFGHVEGLEADASLIQDVRWRDRIRVGTLDANYGVSAKYDLLLMLDVLEHIADDRAALDAARVALRPGCHILLTVPALPALWSRHDEANAHYRRYRADGLRAVLEASGFVVETVRYYFFWTLVPLLARRWLAPAGAGSSDYEVRIPPAPINRTLEFLSRFEHAVGGIVRWPLASSLLAIARRPATDAARFSRGERLLSNAIPGE